MTYNFDIHFFLISLGIYTLLSFPEVLIINCPANTYLSKRSLAYILEGECGSSEWPVDLFVKKQFLECSDKFAMTENSGYFSI